jgi:anti-sigma factor RsiW
MMDSEHIEPLLVGYHFGEVDDGERSTVEAHLLACPGCLRAYLETKRAIETAEAEPRPSAAARARLRRAVAVEVGAAPRPARRWESPLAFAFAVVAVVAAMLATRIVTSQSSAPYALSHAER